MKRYELVYATPKDIVAFYGAPPLFTIRAMVLKEDGFPVALGGVMNHPQGSMAVMEAREGISKKQLLKATRTVIDRLFSQYQYIYAMRDCSLPTSLNYLLRIGFEPMDNNDEVFVWTRTRPLLP